jgi:hypothetical protein
MKVDEISDDSSSRRRRSQAFEVARAQMGLDDDKQNQAQTTQNASMEQMLQIFSQILRQLFPNVGGADDADSKGGVGAAGGCSPAGGGRAGGPPSAPVDWGGNTGDKGGASPPAGLPGPSVPGAGAPDKKPAAAGSGDAPAPPQDSAAPTASSSPPKAGPTQSGAAPSGSGGQSSYGPGSAKYIMSEAQRDARYYEGGKPGDQSYFGSSKNTKSKTVAEDITRSVKDNWNEVDPEVRKGFDSGKFDNFWADDKKPPGFDKMEGWKKAALFELGKSSFETAGTFDPNHKDPGDQAWGNFSLYNKDSNWKSYGLKGDPRSPENRAALTSPGYGVIADLNTLKQSHDLKQSGNGFADDKWLDRAHFTFVDVNKGMGEYNRQKGMVMDATFAGGANVKERLGTNSLYDFVQDFK